ncbi:MAG: SDR family oxidoreductase, partial [Dehalococcoidia bacterium]|nr:SDR family oxidoreductase [Dehalococcoidia bacterium]
AAAEETAQEIIRCGGAARAIHLDVAKSESVDQCVASVLEWNPRIDVLVNNAGITRDARTVKMTEEMWDAVISVNLKGVWLCTRAVAPIMIDKQRGSIINASSVVALYGNYGQANYAAAKGGLISMTKTWAREFGPYNVRVNVVTPGFVETEMVRTVPEKVISALSERTPMKRLCKPEEVASVYAFLASDDASFINGAVIPVDGGLTL